MDVYLRDRRRLLRGFLFTLFSSILFLSATAWAEPITILPGEDIINLGPKVTYLADPSGTLTIDQFRTAEFQAKLKPTEMDTPSFGFTDDTYWFQVDLIHNGNHPFLAPSSLLIHS